MTLWTEGQFALRFPTGMGFVKGARYGEFIVHRNTGGGGGYRVSHLPTGGAIGAGFRKFKHACGFVEAIQPLRNDWAVMTLEDFKNETLRRQVETIWKKFTKGRQGFAGQEIADEHVRPLLNGYRTQ